MFEMTTLGNALFCGWAVGGRLLAVGLLASLGMLLAGYVGGRLSKSSRSALVKQYCDDFDADSRKKSNKKLKKVVAVVNPVGGRARAGPVFNSVLPLLHDVCFEDVETIVTKAAGDARNIADRLAQSGDSDTILVCVGGDGLLHEIVNGIAYGPYGSPKSKAAPRFEAFSRIPISMIAEGTGNGVSTSLNVRTTKDACNAILKQCIKATDIICVEQFEGAGNCVNACAATLSVGWGLVADHDFLAEVELRKFGWIRKTIAPLKVIMDKKQYTGRLSWIIEDGKESSANNEPRRGRKDIKEALNLHGSGGKWRYVDDTFVCVHICNMHWTANDAHMAPCATPNDGLLTAVVVRGQCPSRWELIKMFMQAETGNHYTKDHSGPCEFIQSKEFRIEPSGGGHIAVDGEITPPLSTRAYVAPSVSRFLFNE